jgi:FkbM family methyltransferase
VLDKIARVLLPAILRNSLGLFALNMAVKNRLTLIAYIWLVHGYYLRNVQIRNGTAYYDTGQYTIEIPASSVGSIIEVFNTGVYDKILKPGGGIVIDVGSHVGTFAIKWASKSKMVLAIEPEINNYNRIKNNLAENDIGNVMVINEALSSCHGKDTLNISKRSSCHSLVYDVGAEHILVTVNTLDRLLASLDMGKEPIDFVKIDAEGAELKVLQGAWQTLKRTSKVSVAIYHTKHNEMQEVIDLLLNHGFSITGDKGLRSYVYAEKSI